MKEKTLVVGDMHGDIWNAKSIFQLASKKECTRIHCVGDFGFFPNLKECSEFLSYVSFESINSGIKFSFIDGNHENHEVLKTLFDNKNSQSIFVKDSIEWFYRGKYFENTLSIGGAHSIDKEHRTIGVDWFDGERISYSDFYRCDSEAGIIFSHDCPSGIDFGVKAAFETYQNRRMLSEICSVVKPKILIHGHYHKFYWHDLKMEYGNLRCIGLGCNLQELDEQCIILENGLVSFL